MKEATGELSTTAITVVAIAAVLTIMTTFLIPTLKKSIDQKTKCSSAVCDCDASKRTCPCTYYEAGSTTGQNVVCDNPHYTGNYTTGN